jgi:hypothetical protein
MAGSANYMYEKASVKGVGYKNVEMIITSGARRVTNTPTFRSGMK